MTADLQYALDWLAIRDLAARYNRFADAGDGHSYAQLYTEDGEFDIVGNRVYRGREEIAAAAAATKVTVHITMDPLIDVDGDSARQTSRLIAVFRAEDRSDNRFVATGTYIDELRRTADGWRFARRRVELDLDVNEVFNRMGHAEAFARLAHDNKGN